MMIDNRYKSIADVVKRFSFDCDYYAKTASEKKRNKYRMMYGYGVVDNKWVCTTNCQCMACVSARDEDELHDMMTYLNKISSYNTVVPYSKVMHAGPFKEHCTFKTKTMSDVLDNAIRHDRDSYQPHVMLPYGLVANAHHLDTMLSFMGGLADIHFSTAPFTKEGYPVMLFTHGTDDSMRFYVMPAVDAQSIKDAYPYPTNTMDDVLSETGGADISIFF